VIGMSRFLTRSAATFTLLLGVVALLALFSNLRGAEPSEPAAAISPFVDVHTHPDPGDPAGSVRAALRAMPAENAARIIFTGKHGLTRFIANYTLGEGCDWQSQPLFRRLQSCFSQDRIHCRG